jgi:hypothetical protein
MTTRGSVLCGTLLILNSSAPLAAQGGARAPTTSSPRVAVRGLPPPSGEPITDDPQLLNALKVLRARVQIRSADEVTSDQIDAWFRSLEQWLTNGIVLPWAIRVTTQLKPQTRGPEWNCRPISRGGPSILSEIVKYRADSVQSEWCKVLANHWPSRSNDSTIVAPNESGSVIYQLGAVSKRLVDSLQSTCSPPDQGAGEGSVPSTIVKQTIVPTIDSTCRQAIARFGQLLSAVELNFLLQPTSLVARSGPILPPPRIWQDSPLQVSTLTLSCDAPHVRDGHHADSARPQPSRLHSLFSDWGGGSVGVGAAVGRRGGFRFDAMTAVVAIAHQSRRTGALLGIGQRYFGGGNRSPWHVTLTTGYNYSVQGPAVGALAAVPAWRNTEVVTGVEFGRKTPEWRLGVGFRRSTPAAGHRFMLPNTSRSCKIRDSGLTLRRRPPRVDQSNSVGDSSRDDWPARKVYWPLS